MHWGRADLVRIDPGSVIQGRQESGQRRTPSPPHVRPGTRLKKQLLPLTTRSGNRGSGHRKRERRRRQRKSQDLSEHDRHEDDRGDCPDRRPSSDPTCRCIPTTVGYRTNDSQRVGRWDVSRAIGTGLQQFRSSSSENVIDPRAPARSSRGGRHAAAISPYLQGSPGRRRVPAKVAPRGDAALATCVHRRRADRTPARVNVDERPLRRTPQPRPAQNPLQQKRSIRVSRTRARPRPPRNLPTRVDEDSCRPRFEARRITECRQLAPDDGQRLLHGVTGVGFLAQDGHRGSRHCRCPLGGELGECVDVAALGPPDDYRVQSPLPNDVSPIQSLRNGSRFTPSWLGPVARRPLTTAAPAFLGSAVPIRSRYEAIPAGRASPASSSTRRTGSVGSAKIAVPTWTATAPDGEEVEHVGQLRDAADRDDRDLDRLDRLVDDPQRDAA